MSKANSRKRQKEEKEGTAGYSSQEYWESRYQVTSGFHEWYCSYSNLQPLLEDFISPDDSVLEIGCGDSPLLTGMLAAGHTGKLHAIDFSKSIVTKVIEDLATSGQAPESITYLEMDARNMTYEKDTWDTVIDKGTLDAMLCNKATGLVNGRALISDACRVLRKAQGTLVFISHIQVETAEFDDWMQSCVLPVLDEHRSFLWKVEAHLGGSARGPNDESESPTVYIVTSKPRRFTRGALLSGVVEMSVKSHADSDEENEEEEEEDE